MTNLNKNNKSLWKRDENQLIKHLKRCDFCGSTFSFSSKIENHNEVSVIRYPIRCKTYFCKYCSVNKKIKLRKKLSHINYNNNMRFLTLTLDSKLYSPEEALCKISYFFNRFCKELRRRKYKFQFFKIIELTNRGYAHIHSLISCFIPFNVVKEIWYKITGSFVVFIKYIENKEILSKYLLKYLSKSISSNSNYLFYLLSKRRYSFSLSLFVKIETISEFLFSNKFFYSLDEIKSYVNNKYFYLFFGKNHFKIHFIT